MEVHRIPGFIILCNSNPEREDFQRVPGEVDEEVMSLVTAWWLMTSSSKLLQHSLDGLEVTRGIACL